MQVIHQLGSGNFNSCMVRLKDMRILRQFNGYSYFNSCMVRLKDRSLCTHSANSPFQFLYGAIKSYFSLFYNCGLLLFQFLYGAIKRGNTISANFGSSYFNSCMVRLKVL